MRTGLSFVGLLFTGVMLTPTGPRCLEYNVRFGDPETETLLALLAPEMDLAEIFLVSKFQFKKKGIYNLNRLVWNED